MVIGSKVSRGTVTENIGVENLGSAIYHNENLPVIGAGRSIWEIAGEMSEE